MKTNKLVVLALTLSFASAYAQSEEQVLNSDPINVDGYLAEEKPATDAELESLKSTVKKYQTENHLYKEKTKTLNKLTNEAEKIGDNAEEKIMANVEAKKAEKRAMDKIQKAEAKLKCLMEDIKSPECDALRGNADIEVAAPVKQEVTTAQAATTPVVSTSEVTTGANPFETIKLAAFAGGTNYNGKTEQLEAEVSTGLRLESNINTRFSMGVGFNFAQLKTEDFANSYYGSQAWSPSYYGAYGSQGREIQYRTMGIDLYGKFFVTQGERFRPYIGAGVGYSQATLKYTENNPYSYGGYAFGNEEYKTSYARGTLMLGSEIMITRQFGLLLEGGYATALGSTLTSQDNKNPYNSPDQKRLRQLGEEIINANALSIFAGAVIVF
ncbi:MAG: outer membrane beta-barrel protein [Bacteriovoracaceae bacterium]